MQEEEIPYLGICLGMQAAVVSFARDGLDAQADELEFNENSPCPIVATIGEWSEEMDLGGTMRLGQGQT